MAEKHARGVRGSRSRQPAPPKTGAQTSRALSRNNAGGVPDWSEGLKTIDLPDLPDAPPPTRRDAERILDAVPAPHRLSTKRAVVAAARAENARAAIARLPGPNESLHGWMNGSWDAWQVVPRLLELAAPAKIRELNIATLGFNKDNTESLLALIDAGQIGRVTFLCSHFYKSHEGDILSMLDRELVARGGRVAAARSHAKILLFELDDGRCFTWRSSANLRSCRNMEQWDLTHDRGLLEYDRAVILGMMDRVAA